MVAVRTIEIGCVLGDLNGDGFADVALATLTAGSGSAPGALIYYGAPTPSWSPTLVVAPPKFGAWSTTLSFTGDVNGDGYDDLVLGAPHINSGGVLFWGSPTGVSNAARLGFGITSDFSYDSWAVAGAGDVNGDGFQDVILGTQDGSAVNVFLGGTTSGVEASPEVLSPTTFDGWSGMSVR
jgi:hypothetical protein